MPELVKNNVVLDKLDVVYVPIDAVRPNAYNPNRMADHEYDLLKRSIQTNGYTRPVIARRSTREIVDGYHRWKALVDLGFTELGVVWVDMTDEQARIATLRLNRAHGDEDAALAADVLRELAGMGALDMAAAELQLDPVEMKRLLGDMPTDELRDLGGMEGTEDMLGPVGQGLTDQDRALGVDTAADERRAREEMLRRAKAEEDRAMSEQDKTAYRLVLIYTGDEAELVKRVLAKEGAETSLPEALLRVCRRHLAAAQAGGEAPG